jgi:lipopolysaccharide exporter
MHMADAPLGKARSFFASTALLVGSTGFSQLLVALSSPALSRIYSPADFGVFAVILSITNFVIVIAGLRYDVAIVLPKHRRNALNLVAVSLAFNCIVSFASAAAAVIATFFFSSTFSAPSLLAVAVVYVFLLGTQQTLRIWLQREHAFAVISTMLIVQSAVTVAVQLGFGFLVGSRPVYLMLGTSLGAGISLLVGALRLKTNPRALLRTATSMRMIAVMRRYKRFPLYTAPYSLVSQISQRGPVIILAALVAPSFVGAFALAQRVIYLPITVIVSSLSQAFFPRAARTLGEPSLGDLVRRVLIASILIFGPAFLFTAPHMRAIFLVIFGAKWGDAGDCAAWLTIATFMMLLTYWLDRIYDIAGRQRLALVLELSYNVTCLSAFAAVLLITHRPIWAVAAFSIISAAYNLVWLWITLRIGKLGADIFFEVAGVLAALVAYCILGNLLLEYRFNSIVLAIGLCLEAALPMVAGALFAMRRLNYSAASVAQVLNTVGIGRPRK